MMTLQSVGLMDSAVIGDRSRVTRQGRQGKSCHNHGALETGRHEVRAGAWNVCLQQTHEEILSADSQGHICAH